MKTLSKDLAEQRALVAEQRLHEAEQRALEMEAQLLHMQQLLMQARSGRLRFGWQKFKSLFCRYVVDRKLQKKKP